MKSKIVIEKRIEFFYKNIKYNFIINKIFNNFIYYKLKNNFSFFNKLKVYNIYINFLIFNYKSHRWFNNLTLNGQKTRNNRKTAKNLNVILNDYKLFLLKKKFNINDVNINKSIIFVEYINLLWKLNWTTEWIELKKKKLYLEKKKIKNLKINFDKYSIQSELISLRSKLLKKKIKILNKSSFVLLGFEPGTAINYIK